MKDVINELNATHREVGDGPSVLLRRDYRAEIEDVWDALTNPERINRWFLDVTGDLRVGGNFQLKGNASGEILRCEPPRLLTVTWEFGEAPASKVEVRLTVGEQPETTVFELEQVLAADEHWKTFGPGATGVGWDLTLLGLSMYLRGEEFGADKEAFFVTPHARELMTRSSEAWGAAHAAAGADSAAAAEATAKTTAFYVPDQN